VRRARGTDTPRLVGVGSALLARIGDCGVPGSGPEILGAGSRGPLGRAIARNTRSARSERGLSGGPGGIVGGLVLAVNSCKEFSCELKFQKQKLFLALAVTYKCTESRNNQEDTRCTGPR